jgi:Domain of unknown function (DUF4398)
VALEHARAAAWAGAPPDQVEHLAYVVSQRAALAEARAAERIARSEIGKLRGALGQAFADGRPEQGGFTRVPLRNHPQRRGLSQKRLEQDRPAWASSAQQDQQADVPQHERESVQQEQETRAPLEQDQHERASVQQDPQTSGPLETDRLERAPLEIDPSERALLEQDQRERASVNEDQQARASVEEHQDAARAAPDNGTTMVGTIHQGITLSLAQLQFEGAEPTSDTLAELAALAERLLSERGRSILIEADFDLPDPEARTEMERRVEAVRAILVRRGIEPARLLVRAAGDAPAEPPASSSFGEPPD